MSATATRTPLDHHEPRQHDEGVGCSCGRSWPCTSWVTPVERHGELWVKREDYFRLGAYSGLKVRAALELGREAQHLERTVLVGLGSRHSSQIAIIATVARHLGLRSRLHTAAGSATPAIRRVLEQGGELVQHQPGYLSVIKARAREDVLEHRDAYGIPFALEDELTVALARAQLRNAPPEARRLVVAVGSGMALAGLLTGWDRPALGLQVGLDPWPLLQRWAPPARLMSELSLEVVRSPLPYSTHVEQPGWPAWAGEPVPLDPVYEAKLVPYLEPGDLLWIVGRRHTRWCTVPATTATTSSRCCW